MYLRVPSWPTFPGAIDHLSQNIHGEVGIRRFGILDDDLSQDQTRNVFAGRGIDDLHILAALQHLGDFIEVHIPAVGGVVKTPVFVFLMTTALAIIFLSYPLTRLPKGVCLIHAAVQQDYAAMQFLRRNPNGHP